MTEQRPPTESELVEFVRSIDVRAPDSLHRRVEALVAASARGRRTRGAGSPSRPFGLAPRLAAAGGIAAAVAAVAIVVGVSGGSSQMTQRDAVALTLSTATHRAPAESRTNHSELAASVEGVAFPYWQDRLGWRSVGERTDHVGGRTVTTVFYADHHGRRVGYAIVSGRAPRSSGGVVHWVGGTPFRVLDHGGVPVVVWPRGGHMCVVSGRGLSSGVLLHLASWSDHGAIAS
jgi:hypothetical protein